MDFHCLPLVKLMQFFGGQSKNGHDPKSKLQNDKKKSVQSLQNIPSKDKEIKTIPEKKRLMQSQTLHKIEDKKNVHHLSEMQNNTRLIPKSHKSGIKSVTIVCNEAVNKRTTQMRPTRHKKTVSYTSSDSSVRLRRRYRTISLSSLKRSLTLKHFLKKRWSGEMDLIKNERRRNNKIKTLFTTSKSLDNSSSSTNKVCTSRNKLSNSSDHSYIDSKDSLFRKVAKSFPWVKKAPVCFVVKTCNHRIDYCKRDDRSRFHVVNFPPKNKAHFPTKLRDLDNKAKHNSVTKSIEIRPSNLLLKTHPEQDCRYVYDAGFADKNQRSEQSLRSCLRQTPHTIERAKKLKNIGTYCTKDSIRYNIPLECGDATSVNSSQSNSFLWTGKENFIFENPMPIGQRPQAARPSNGSLQIKRLDPNHCCAHIYPKYSSNSLSKTNIENEEVLDSAQAAKGHISQKRSDLPLIDNKNIGSTIPTKPNCIVNNAMPTCGSKQKETFEDTKNRQIINPKVNTHSVDKIIAGERKVKKFQCVKVNLDKFKRETNSSKEKFECKESTQSAFCDVPKCFSTNHEINEAKTSSAHRSRTARRTLRHILFSMITLAWSPCILMGNIRRLFITPFHKKHCINSQTRLKLDRKKDKSMHRCSLWSNFAQRIKQKHNPSKRSKAKIASNIQQQKNQPNGKRIYSLYQTSDRRWVLKPTRSNRTRRRRLNFRSIFQTYNYKSSSKSILHNKMSVSSSHAYCPSGLKKTSGSSGKFPLWKPLYKHRETPSKVSFVSSSEDTHSERGSKPRMRRSKLVCRGDKMKQNCSTQCQSALKRTRSASSLTQKSIKSSKKKTEIVTITSSRLDCGDHANPQTGKTQNKKHAPCKNIKADGRECNTNISSGDNSGSSTNKYLKEEKREKNSFKRTENKTKTTGHLNCGDSAKSQARKTQNKESVLCKCIKADSCECYTNTHRDNATFSTSSDLKKRNIAAITEPNKENLSKKKSDSYQSKSNFKKIRGTTNSDKSSHKSSARRKTSVTEVTRKNNKEQYDASVSSGKKSVANLAQESSNLKKVKAAINCNDPSHKKSKHSMSTDICEKLELAAKQNKKSIIVISSSQNKNIFKKIQALIKKSGASIQCTSDKTGKKKYKKSSPVCVKADISKNSIKTQYKDKCQTRNKKYRSGHRGSIFSLISSSNAEKQNQSLQCVILPKASKHDKATEYKYRKINKKIMTLPFCKKLICRKRKSQCCLHNIGPCNKKRGTFNFRMKRKPQTCLNIAVPIGIPSKTKQNASVSCCILLPAGNNVSTQPSKLFVSKHRRTTATVEKVCSTIKKIKCNCARTCHRRRSNRDRVSRKSRQICKATSSCLPISLSPKPSARYPRKVATQVVVHCRTHRSQQCSNTLLSSSGCLQPNPCPNSRPCQKPHSPCPTPQPSCNEPYPSCPTRQSLCYKPYPPCPTRQPSCNEPYVPCPTRQPSCYKQYPPCPTRQPSCNEPYPPCTTRQPCYKPYPPCPTRQPPCYKPCSPCPTRQPSCNEPYPPCPNRRGRPCCCRKEKRQYCFCGLKRKIRCVGCWIRCAFKYMKRIDCEAWEDQDFSTCDNIVMKSIRRKPYYECFSCCPNCYPAFLSCHKTCCEFGRCCMMCVAGCFWIPCIALCYYTCVGLCRACP